MNKSAFIDPKTIMEAGQSHDLKVAPRVKFELPQPDPLVTLDRTYHPIDLNVSEAGFNAGGVATKMNINGILSKPPRGLDLKTETASDMQGQLADRITDGVIAASRKPDRNLEPGNYATPQDAAEAKKKAKELDAFLVKLAVVLKNSGLSDAEIAAKIAAVKATSGSSSSGGPRPGAGSSGSSGKSEAERASDDALARATIAAAGSAKSGRADFDSMAASVRASTEKYRTDRERVERDARREAEVPLPLGPTPAPTVPSSPADTVVDTSRESAFRDGADDDLADLTDLADEEGKEGPSFSMKGLNATTGVAGVGYTLIQLKRFATDLELKGRSGLKKQPLLDLIRAHFDGASSSSAPRKKKGRGFQSEPPAHSTAVGSQYSFDLPKFDQNILSLFRVNARGTKVKAPGFKNREVSDAFQEALLDTLESRRISDLSELAPGEREYFMKVLSLTNPELGQVKPSHAEKLSEYKQERAKKGATLTQQNRLKKMQTRLVVLAGEMGGGNTKNPAIHGEIRSILEKMIAKKVIDQAEAQAFIDKYVR
jgi:hypothetical protein